MAASVAGTLGRRRRRSRQPERPLNGCARNDSLLPDFTFSDFAGTVKNVLTEMNPNTTRRRIQSALNEAKKAKREAALIELERYVRSGATLERSDAARLFQAVDPKNLRPTEEELDYILAMATPVEVKDGEWGEHRGLSIAVEVWGLYLMKRNETRAKLQEFDLNKSGKLEENEIVALLQSLRPSRQVTEEEVENLLFEVDGIGERALGAPGVAAAIVVWDTWLLEGFPSNPHPFSPQVSPFGRQATPLAP